MRYAYRRFGLVDVLSARAGGAIGVDPAIALADFDLYPVIDHRVDPNGREACMPSRVGIERGNAHQPMNSGLGLEPAMRIVALDHDGRRLDAGLIAIRLLDQLDGELSSLSPAHI